jgi:ribosome-binding factor A
MPSARLRRVNEAIREVVGEHIAGDLKDPRIAFVTVTAVETSPDLSHARVYVSVMGTTAERDDTLTALQAAHGFLQARVGEELRMKRTPRLAFVHDDSIQRGMRISELIDREVGEEPGS